MQGPFRAGGAVVLVTLTWPAFAQDPPEQGTESAEGVIMLAPVSVTANKREQTDFEVSGSVAVKTGEALEKERVNSTDTLDTLFPELQSMGRSSRVYNNFTLRGLSSGDFYGPAVGLNVDGVPQLPHAYAQALENVDRVELVKGPQGAVYGRGALGGVINVESALPDDEPAVWTDVQAFSRGHRVSGGGSSGLHAGWAIQGMATDSMEDGSLDDPNRDRKNVDDRRVTSGRASLHYLPADQPFRARLKIGTERYRSEEEYYVPLDDLSRDRVNPVVTTPKLNRRLDDISLDATREITDRWSTTGIVAWQEMFLERTFGTYGIDTKEDQNSLYGELRANYKSDDFSFLVGYSGQRQHFKYKDVGGEGSIGFMGGPLSDNTMVTHSLFTDSTLRFAPRWEISAGARVAWEKADSLMSIPDETGAAVDYENDATFWAITPHAALAYLPSDSHRLWVGIGRGYKPGGFNKAGTTTLDTASYGSETVLSFETGWKYQSEDQKLRTEVTLYDIESHEVQGYSGPAGLMTLSNMGDARSLGVEVNATAVVFEDQEVSVGGMVNRSRFTKGQYEGNITPYAPAYSLRASWTGHFGEGGRWQPTATVRHVGEHYFDESNTLRQGAYTVVDAGLSYETDHGVTLGVYGRNLSDTIYQVYANSYVGAQLGAPQEFGLHLTARF
ncbi:TonB-dependent receptor [Pararhodospirillum oryzae]|uniref:TonB-dependent receptor n=1 Tax=Pararhodospirillum oryzae TaxID=478448 RepID=A0A512HB57_9PROT|nr:TonB-dependent receptor [Pararhodospirillum oryzae]GEO82684.1 TonB-dependent receptor [Pararhodospirillum oryzae]